PRTEVREDLSVNARSGSPTHPPRLRPGEKCEWTCLRGGTPWVTEPLLVFEQRPEPRCHAHPSFVVPGSGTPIPAGLGDRNRSTCWRSPGSMEVPRASTRSVAGQPEAGPKLGRTWVGMALSRSPNHRAGASRRSRDPLEIPRGLRHPGRGGETTSDRRNSAAL